MIVWKALLFILRLPRGVLGRVILICRHTCNRIDSGLYRRHLVYRSHLLRWNQSWASHWTNSGPQMKSASVLAHNSIAVILSTLFCNWILGDLKNIPFAIFKTTSNWREKSKRSSSCWAINRICCKIPCCLVSWSRLRSFLTKLYGVFERTQFNSSLESQSLSLESINLLCGLN